MLRPVGLAHVSQQSGFSKGFLWISYKRKDPLRNPGLSMIKHQHDRQHLTIRIINSYEHEYDTIPPQILPG